MNEIDDLRRANLDVQGFKIVTSGDASIQFPASFRRRFSAVLTNPPFGSVDVKVEFDGYPISSLEQLMAVRALECMADTGRAAIIIGGYTTWNERGRIQAGKNRIFFNYLYSHYHVEDVINIDGHKLYSRQGTSFDVRLILISGRKAKPEGAAPLKSAVDSATIMDFDALYSWVMSVIHRSVPIHHKQLNMPNLKTRALALELELELDDAGLGAPYEAASDTGKSLQTQVPDSIGLLVLLCESGRICDR